jgi:transmembrane sensor
VETGLEPAQNQKSIMERKNFREILKKYLSGQASEHEVQIIEEWYRRMGQERDEIDDGDKQKYEQRYLTNIMRHVQKDEATQSLKRDASIRQPKYFIAIAASVVLLIVSFFIIIRNEPPQNRIVDNESKESNLNQIANNGKTAQRYTLPDGSSVTLQPNSVLKISPGFNRAMREVQLDGEGFFEVTPDKKKPFFVYTRDVTTRVLGTSFTVRSFQKDKNVTVAVKTGKVSVYSNSPTSFSRTQEIILTPNQEVTYDRTEHVTARRIVEKPEPIVPAKEIELLRFEEAPLHEVIKAIENVYGVQIEYDVDKFSSCTLTTAISGGGLYNRMDIITSAIGASYELKEDRIVIQGSGCNYRKK